MCQKETQVQNAANYPSLFIILYFICTVTDSCGVLTAASQIPPNQIDLLSIEVIQAENIFLFYNFCLFMLYSVSSCHVFSLVMTFSFICICCSLDLFQPRGCFSTQTKAHFCLLICDHRLVVVGFLSNSQLKQSYWKQWKLCMGWQ